MTPAEIAADEIMGLIKEKTVSKLIPIPTRRQVLRRVRAAVAATQESCAVVADEFKRENLAYLSMDLDAISLIVGETAKDIAAAIRVRGDAKSEVVGKDCTT